MRAHDETIRRVWHAHDSLRMSIPQIAKRLLMGESEVRACIAEVWGMTNAERVDVGLRMPRWEDDE